MTDKMTPEQRHKCMSHIRSKATKPELKVRQWLWNHGYRYRLNVKSVPGKPDIVMRPYRTAIFVNGCFWHGHGVMADGRCMMEDVVSSKCCKIPSTNREFWVNKIHRNQERDKRNYDLLQENGWQVIVIWECQLTNKKLEQTMREVELLLNENMLALHRKPTPIPFHTEEEPLPMAAEGGTMYGEKPKHIEVVAAALHDSEGRIFATQRGYGEWKDYWELPGGKIEAGETAEAALHREISEELAAEIEIGSFIQTVEWDYPKFHLTMHVFWCRLVSGAPTLKEHEAARWLAANELESVDWLPADFALLPCLKTMMQQRPK